MKMGVYTKYDLNGSIHRYKTRLVAHGFSQIYGIDYKETFSPVVRLNSIHIIVTLAVNQGWSLHQLDVSNAFLYGDPIECGFMEQPLGYVVQGETTQVCHLYRAMYGLKQSPCAWFAKFSQLILSQGLTPCEVDPNVFQTSTSDGCIILVVYVNDILVIWSNIAGISQVKDYLHWYLPIWDLGSLKYFLVIEFAYRPVKLVLNQQKYVLDILTEVEFLGCKPRASPSDSKPNS